MRNLGDVPTGGSGDYPAPGKHLCRCTQAMMWKSPKKGAPGVKLLFVTRDGEHNFDDVAFVSGKALWRLALIAQRLCGAPKDMSLPDDNNEAADTLAQYILQHAGGKDAMLTIEEKAESYIVESGPDIGQTKTVMRRRVSGGGYARPSDVSTVAPLPADAAASKDDDDSIPF